MKLEEISTDSLNDMRELFAGRQLQMVIDSILCRNTDGRLWILAPEDASLFALLWDQGNNKFYLAGRQAPRNNSALRRTIEDEICAAASARGALYFGVRVLMEELKGLAEESFGKYRLGTRDGCFYVYPVDDDSAESEPAPAKEPEDTRFLSIDRDFLLDLPDGGDAVVQEIEWMWPSVERFLQRGWGTAAVVEGQLACWCTAEYVSRHSCGMGIETAADMRNRGLATAAASEFIRESLTRGCRPHWECAVDNEPSVRVAEKLGFKKAEYHSSLIGKFE